MRDDGRALAFGALALFAAAGLVRKGSRDEEQTFTRDGFPWPIETPVYHATAFADEILRQSFRTRQQGAPEMTGGSWTSSTSLTLLLDRATAIVLGLETFIRGARSSMSCVELLETLWEEIPEAFPDGLTQGSNFQGIVWQRVGNDATARQAIDAVMPVLHKIDRGWVFVRAWDESERDTLPSHAQQIGQTEWLIPPETKGGRCPAGASRCFFELYRDALVWGNSQKVCFNPQFIGTRMDLLAKKRTSDVSVLECRVHIPRVCTDFQGAVQLGFIPGDLPFSVRERMDGYENDCHWALRQSGRRLDGYALGRKNNPLFSPSWFSRDEPVALGRAIGWTIMDEGKREPETTMLYHSREEELIVFAPRRIQVVERLRMPYLRRIFGLGHRITFPWFDPKTTLEKS